MALMISWLIVTVYGLNLNIMMVVIYNFFFIEIYIVIFIQFYILYIYSTKYFFES